MRFTSRRQAIHPMAGPGTADGAPFADQSCRRRACRASASAPNPIKAKVVGSGAAVMVYRVAGVPKVDPEDVAES